MGFPGHAGAFWPEAGQPLTHGRFPALSNSVRRSTLGHYPKPDEWLTNIGADTIVGFFGLNESFDGEAGLANFRAELSAFVGHTLKKPYNGKAAPQLVLGAPIAMEQHPLPKQKK